MVSFVVAAPTPHPLKNKGSPCNIFAGTSLISAFSPSGGKYHLLGTLDSAQVPRENQRHSRITIILGEFVYERTHYIGVSGA